MCKFNDVFWDYFSHFACSSSESHQVSFWHENVFHFHGEWNQKTDFNLWDSSTFFPSSPQQPHFMETQFKMLLKFERNFSIQMCKNAFIMMLNLVEILLIAVFYTHLPLLLWRKASKETKKTNPPRLFPAISYCSCRRLSLTHIILLMVNCKEKNSLFCCDNNNEYEGSFLNDNKMFGGLQKN